MMNLYRRFRCRWFGEHAPQLGCGQCQYKLCDQTICTCRYCGEAILKVPTERWQLFLPRA